MRRMLVLATCILLCGLLSGCKTMDNFLNKSSFAIVNADAPVDIGDLLAGKKMLMTGDFIVARIPKGEKFMARKDADGTWITEVNSGEID
jgi:hypothetical protein